MDTPQLRVERPERLLRERVVDVLREAILDGTLAQGRRLTDRELVELTGVSRTSLREALRQLEAEGLVEKSPSRGLQVSRLTPDTVGHLYDIRVALELAAIELFIRNASAAQMDELLGTLGAFNGSSTMGDDEFENHMRSLGKFYALLLKGAANPILEQMVDSVIGRVNALRRVSVRLPGRLDASAEEFAELKDALAARDVERAREVTRRHIDAARAAAMQVVGDPSGLPGA